MIDDQHLLRHSVNACHHTYNVLGINRCFYSDILFPAVNLGDAAIAGVLYLDRQLKAGRQVSTILDG